MANVELKQFDYTDDFGKEYKNFKLKFERGMLNRADFGYYDNRSNTKTPSCGGARYFTPRRIKAVFTDGKSIELPIPTLNDVKEAIEDILGKDDLACASLIGESWRVIPAGILGGEYATDGLAGADKPDTRKVRYEYTLDGGSQIIRAINIESQPDDLADAQEGCLKSSNDPTSIVCTIGTGISPRHFKGYRVNTTTGGRFGRMIPVSSNDTDAILGCGKDTMEFFNCLGYKGESMANVADFYSAGGVI